MSQTSKMDILLQKIWNFSQRSNNYFNSGVADHTGQTFKTLESFSSNFNTNVQ